MIQTGIYISQHQHVQELSVNIFHSPFPDSVQDSIPVFLRKVNHLILKSKGNKKGISLKKSVVDYLAVQ